MLSLLLQTFASVVTVHVATAVTTETVVGVAGQRVALPCRLEAVNQEGVDVCWGRGKPSLFTCHNMVIHTSTDKVDYRKSYRFSLSSSSSFLYISSPRPSDTGFYHCRVLLPGLFNDQTSTVHLIIISPQSLVPESSSEESAEDPDGQEAESLNTPPPTAGQSRGDDAQQTGSDVSTTGPVLARVQAPVQQQQVNSLELFISNTVRLSFIIFIPAVLLTAAYRVWRSKQRSNTNGRPTQSEEPEDGNSSV